MLCPLCNGLSKLYLHCPVCNSSLEDKGMLEYYFEPYSPYLEEEILDMVDGVGPEECIHVFSCPNCSFEHVYIVKKIRN